MRRFQVSAILAGALLAGCASAAAPAAPPQHPHELADYQPPTPLQLSATTVRTYVAPEADQGVAVDAHSFYAIDNSMIAKYDIATGELQAGWAGPAHGLIRHMNSCFAEAGKLWCANSNYSLTPMGSSIEVFDARRMTHIDSHSLGMTDEGSLVWFGRLDGGWIAGFAHYDETGGLTFKDHRFSSVVTFDADWRRTGGWLFPADILERMAPHAASGGVIGPDGLLYVLGHDRQEMYVLARPDMGPVLIHVATISLQAEGQAFSWSKAGDRTIYTVDRHHGQVLAISLPAVDIAGFPDARRFR
ncbi:MAG: hypothetical protein GC155_11830 [Alphaproteobacteria bacterium]|nr:hypothetical protein [Alphaproteobacteria bacterium]